jgi:hypothetical protein
MLSVIFLLALGVAGAGSAAAQDKKAGPEEKKAGPQSKAAPQEPAQPKAQADPVTISGQLTAQKDNVLIVKDDQNNEHKVAVTAETKVVKGGKDAAVTDLKPNDKVMVIATKGSDGTLTATSIEASAE